MIIAIQNTIGAIRSLLGTVMSGLKMWLPLRYSQQLGEELVVNGDFDTDSDWNKTGTWSIESNYATANGNGASQYLQQDFTITNGKVYLFTYEIIENTLNGVGSALSGTGGFVQVFLSNVVGTHQVYITADDSGAAYALKIGVSATASTGTIKLDNISVKEIGQFSLDETTNNNDAKLLTGNCLDFDGTNDYLDIGTNNVESSYFTVAAWIYKHDNSQATIFNTAETSSPYEGTDCYISSTGQIGTFANNGFRYSSTIIQLNQWNRIVWKFYKNSSSGTVEASLNGGTFFSIYSGNTGSSNLLVNDGRIQIGRYQLGSNYFNGYISDVQLYNIAWTQADVANDYAKPNEVVSSVPTVNLVGYWAMTEGNGGLAYDSSSLLSEEILADGDFALTGTQAINTTGTYWITGSRWSIANGKATFSGTLNKNLIVNDSNVLTAGSTYQLTFTISNSQTSTPKMWIGNNVGGVDYVSGGVGATGNYNIYANGIHTVTFTVPSGQTSLSFYGLGSSGAFELSNISVKEVTPADNGALILGTSWLLAQSTIPQLGMMDWSKGSNLLTYSEDFSEWTSANTLVSGFISPLGDASAYKISGTSSTVLPTSVDLTGRTRSVYARTVSGTGTANLMTYYENGDVFNLTETWQRFEVTGWSATGAPNFYLTDFRGTGNLSEFLIWGAQEVVGTSAGNYRKTNGTAVTNAILPPYPVNPTTDVLGNLLRQRLDSLNLTGTGYGEVTDSASINPSAITIQCWIFGNTEENRGIVSKFNNPSPRDYLLYKHISNGFRLYIGSIYATSGTIPTTGWINIAATYDGSNIKTFINGELSTTTVTTVAIPNNTNVLEIGRYDGNSVTAYSERIDDVKLYDRALTTDEVEQNYKAGLSTHLSLAELNADAFQLRVIADGGVFESYVCLKDQLTTLNNIL